MKLLEVTVDQALGHAMMGGALSSRYWFARDHHGQKLLLARPPASGN
jgi:hypothetical protein